MKANELAQEMSSNPIFEGLDIKVDRHFVRVYGFHQTPDWEVTKAKLEEMGFRCGPNFGSKECDSDEPEPGPNPVVASAEEWDAQVRGR